MSYDCVLLLRLPWIAAFSVPCGSLNRLLGFSFVNPLICNVLLVAFPCFTSVVMIYETF